MEVTRISISDYGKKKEAAWPLLFLYININLNLTADSL